MKVPTKVKVIQVDGTETLAEFELDDEPSYAALMAVVQPRLDGHWSEHVNVWDDFGDGEMRHLDMFVDETGLIKGLPRNDKATIIYRRANLCGMSAVLPVSNPELLNVIVGPAVLFNRRVWF